jgi:serine/threonine protein kinase
VPIRGEGSLSSELSAGAVFAERYRVERRLAAGGMGAVYEVVHIETNRRRALKVLHAKFLQSDVLMQRFRQEARVASNIDSEHIVDIYDAGVDTATNMPFLVMELLRGEDLRARVRRDGPMPADEVVRCLYETCLALEKTHQANIVHRDLKPDNLFLCEREHGPPRIKVLDFGIAKIIADGATETQLTQSLGTPLYMAPEQFALTSSVSPATDIFALGLIAYTMLVGKPYWSVEARQAKSPIAFALHAYKGPKISPVKRAAERKIHLPPAFDVWFFRATAEQPGDRFPSAMSAISELANVLGAPLPHELARGKSGPTSVSHQRPTPPTADPDNTEVEPAVQNGSLSASLLSVRTIRSSDLIAEPPKSKRYVLISTAGIIAILLAGPLFDTMISTTRAPTFAVGASSSTKMVVITSAEPSPITSANNSPSVSAIAPPPMNQATSITPMPSATSTASAPIPTPTKSPEVRPSATIKKNTNRSIWNND